MEREPEPETETETEVERGRCAYAPLRFDGKDWDRVDPAAPIPPPAALRIVTWNVWFGAHRFKARLAPVHGSLSSVKGRPSTTQAGCRMGPT